MALPVKRFNVTAILPKKAFATDAGFDLYSCEDISIAPSTSELIDTGIGIILPAGTYGHVAPRSSLARKNIIVNGGIIDSGYRDSIKVILYNLSSVPYKINKGDRIAQLIIQQISTISTVMEVNELETSDRGLGGFGSTGK